MKLLKKQVDLITSYAIDELQKMLEEIAGSENVPRVRVLSTLAEAMSTIGDICGTDAIDLKPMNDLVDEYTCIVDTEGDCLKETLLKILGNNPYYFFLYFNHEVSKQAKEQIRREDFMAADVLEREAMAERVMSGAVFAIAKEIL